MADEEPTEETRRAMAAAEAKALGLTSDDSPTFDSSADVLAYLEAQCRNPHPEHTVLQNTRSTDSCEPF